MNKNPESQANKFFQSKLQDFTSLWMALVKLLASSLTQAAL